MLSKEQQNKLNGMVKKYRITMLVKHKASPEQVAAWGLRYEAAMSQFLQKQGKR